MACLFMPLPRAATYTNCSTNVLLNTSLHATSRTATTLWSSSHTSVTLTSNSIICDNTFMHLNKPLRSPVGWRLWEATILLLFQPPGVYKQASLSQSIQNLLCSCLDNIVFTSPLPAACCTGRAIPSTQDFVPGGRDAAPSVSSQHFGCRHLHHNILLPSSSYHWYLPWDCLGMPSAWQFSVSHTWAVTLP